MARGKVLKDPQHWYFPISYREMYKRRMRNIDKALRKIGLARAELKKEWEKKEWVKMGRWQNKSIKPFCFGRAFISHPSPHACVLPSLHCPNKSLCFNMMAER